MLRNVARFLTRSAEREIAMKILITTDVYAFTTNGVVTSVRNLYEELVRDGHDVRILTLSTNQHSHRVGPVYYIRSVSIGYVYPDMRMPTSYRHRLIKELIAWCPDVIHSQCEFFTFEYAQRISRKTGAPIVHTYHTLYEQYASYVLPSRRLGDQVVKTFSRVRLKNVKRVIAPSNKVKKVLEGYGLDNSISIVPSGIDLSQHAGRLTGEQRQDLRTKLGIRPDQLVMLNLGRLGAEKRLDELMELFAGILRDFPNVVFLIVGDGPAKPKLEQMSRQSGMENRVMFTGMVDPSTVQQYYQIADLFVSSSTSETQGLTFVEAAANGLPLLCREDPCLQEVLIPGENGYTFTNEAQFRSGLTAIVSDPAWRAAAGERSRQIAAGFDKEAFGDHVEAIYEDVIKE